MLTEECVFPKGNDTTYLGKLVTAFKRHEHFREVKTSSTEFAVRHYAGEVVYTVTDFIEKNKDPISQDLQVRLPSVSSLLFLSERRRLRTPGCHSVFVTFARRVVLIA